MERRPVRQHPFDIMVMGRREDSSTDESIEELPSEHQENSRDTGDLMGNIETLMAAVSELKPLFDKVKPLINKWTKS
ncbi:hypothetical protein V1502_05820 [Bacillus sp. SCS-153A]|uniref:hypothetical protein n=1 Tax=Rossellomorea sedimentorum TaxID=3115294 RepID=UPI0039062B84